MPLQPDGKDAHHAEPRRPRIVVGCSKRVLPTQEQIDRDVIRTFTVSERGEAAQHAA
jgi:hypothetical protein